MDLGVVIVFPKLSYAPRDVLRARIGIRPEGNGWNSHLVHSHQGLIDLTFTLAKLRRHGMLGDKEKGLIEAKLATDSLREQIRSQSVSIVLEQFGHQIHPRTAN